MVENDDRARTAVQTPDSEKIAINLGYVDLGHIDLLVRDGFYSNRTDFIRTVIRNQVERHAEAARPSVANKSLEPGLRHCSRADFDAARNSGRLLQINVLGLVSIALDVTADLARASVTLKAVQMAGLTAETPREGERYDARQRRKEELLSTTLAEI